jgi:hypothetical protein
MTVHQYTRNPVPISAVQYTVGNSSELRDFGVTFTDSYGVGLLVQGLEEAEVCNVGDYVRRRPTGEFVVSPKAVFEAEYTVVP